MNIDQTNFSKHLSQILQQITQCDFIAFDGEFSGLKATPFASQNEFQSQEQFYQRMKDTCINFSLLQLGLCMFSFKDKAYVPHCYNIYIKNNTGRPGVNNCALSQIECLDFLARNKMDLGRVFSRGIESVRMREREFVERKCKEGIQEAPKEYVFLAQKDQGVLEEVVGRLTEFRGGKEKEIQVDFVNRTVFNEIKKKFNLQMDKDQKRELKEFEYVVRQNKNKSKVAKPKQPQIEKKQEQVKQTQEVNQVKIEKKVEEQVKQVTEEVRQTKEIKKEEKESQAPKITGSQQIKEKRQKKKSSSEQFAADKSTVKQRIEDLMGFTLVIQHMIKSKKPIIGHYANLDLGFLYQTFIDELPDTFEEFCKELRGHFPYIFDTKVVSKKIQKQIKGLRVDLSSLFDACHDRKTLGPYANIDLEAYEGDEVKHQAGYDAYITGCAFIAMMNYIQVNLSKEKEEKPQKNPHKPKKNKHEQPKPALQLQALNFEDSPFNCIIYSKATGQVVLDGKNTNKLDKRVLIIQGCFKSACAELTKYDSLRVVIKQNIFVKFDNQQDIPSIISSTKSDKFSLLPYPLRKQFRAHKYF